MTQAKLKNKQWERVTLPLSEYRYRARKNSSAFAIWLAAETLKKFIHFYFPNQPKYD